MYPDARCSVVSYRAGSETRVRRRFALTIAVLLLATACSGGDEGDGVATLQDGDDGGATTTTVSRTAIDEAALEFSRCMRDNGIDVPDIEFGSDGAPTLRPEDIAGIDLTSPEFEEAFATCIGTLQAAGAAQIELDPELQALVQDQLQEFSACMRDNGVEDFPDPDFTGGQAYPISAFLQFEDEAFQTALEACRDVAFIPGIGEDGGE
jgi:hypothetical protein